MLLFITACESVSVPQSRTLSVFAASSLTDAFSEIGQNFETAHPGIKIKYNFAGSQALRTQIEQGATADVFASANLKEMDALVSENIVPANAATIFLTNLLLVILPPQNPAHIQSLADLAKPGLKLVLAAEVVPVGNYARQILANLDFLYGAGYKEKVMANVVSNEDNVKQVVTKVQLGEADGGIVYISDAIATPGLKTIEIPVDYNIIAKYPIAVIGSTHRQDLADEFIIYILSPAGQSILKKLGFTPILP